MDGTNQIKSLSENIRDRFIKLVDLTGEKNNKNTSYNSLCKKLGLLHKCSKKGESMLDVGQERSR